MEFFETLNLVFLTLGGAGALFWALSSYIGGIWAERYKRSVEHEYNLEMESFKKDLDLIKESSSRYSGKQFDLYTSLYHSLCDLKEKGDLLWEGATIVRLKNFTLQLKKTKNEVEKSYLFLETAHYEKFMEIFRHFSEYRIGKESILKIKIDDENFIRNGHEFQNWIEHNRIQREEYNRLVDEIRKDLRDQLRGRQ